MAFNKIACVLFFAFAVTSISGAQSATTPTSRAAIGANLENLPLAFEVNRGQTGSTVNFVSRGSGYTAFLTGDGMVLSLRSKQTAKVQALAPTAKVSTAVPTTLQFRLLGAASNPAVVGEQVQPGRVNYFLGKNPAKWLRNIPTYAQVRYKNIYPGIDLVYYGNHRQLEYDFAVAPGANPGQIKFEIRGASQIKLDANGNLVLATKVGEIQFQTPAIYQESNGQRTAVSGTYVVNDPTHVSFQVAHYDANKPLVIDPVLIYSTYLGGSGNDQGTGIAVDASGNVYVAGSTDSVDFPLAALSSQSNGNSHVFISKIDPTGANLLYTDYLGGSGTDNGYALALDAANNVYVTGSTTSSDFPMMHAFQGTYPGGFDAFLSKVSADGSSLLYSTYFGANGSVSAVAVGVDGNSDMVIAGYTSSTNLPVANAYQATVSPNLGGSYGNYGFVTKFTPDGSSLVYSTYLGGSTNVPLNCGGTPCWPQPDSTIAGMVVDTAGNAYVAGATNTYNFPITTGAYLATDTTQMNGTVGFVSKFGNSGGLDYSIYFYEASGVLTNINAIAVDGAGSAYVTGVAYSDGTFPITSTSICDPSTNSWQCDYGFVTKFDATGSTLLYSTFLAPNNNANPQSIVVDGSNNAYVLASTQAGLFNLVNGIENYSTGNDILLDEIDATGTSQLFATYLGGSGDDEPGALTIDASGNLYATGMTDSTDFPVTEPAFQSVFGGDTDAFILKIAPASAAAVSLNPVSLQYGTLAVGSSSQPQSVLLRNMGSSALLISSITRLGDFSETDDCGSSVAAAGSCVLSVIFTPSAGGSRIGTITVHDDAAGSAQVITLSGSALGAGATVTPSSLTFAAITMGTSSTSQAVTLSNSGNEPLTIGVIQVAGDYAQTNNCPTSLAAGSSCTVNVIFTPSVTGTRAGTLTISDSVAPGVQTVALSGSGADFSVTSSPTSATVKAGVAATYTLTISPLGGTFASPVKVSCSGAPAKATCSLSASSVTPGSSSAKVTLTISTTATSAELTPLLPARNRPSYAVWMQLNGFGLFGMLFVGSKRRKKTLSLIALALLISAMLVMSACAGGTGVAPQTQPGTTPGTYTITVLGSSGALQHSLPLTLTVQ